jgi:ribulose-phosphate 3-epimerase
MKKVAVSIHATEDFNPNIIANLKGLDYIHVDVADGKFTKVKYDNLEIFKILKARFDIPIIAHMMVKEPSKFLPEIIDYIDIFTFHYEIEQDMRQIIKNVKIKKKKVGIALNPNTDTSNLLPLLKDLDLVLIMSVYPGESGQQFLNESFERVNILNQYKKGNAFLLDIDGGINLENAKLLNVDILSSTTTILKAKDPIEVIKLLKS